MSQPQSPPYYPPPPPPQKQGLSTGAIIAIVVAVVVVVVIVGGLLAVGFLSGIQQASNLSKPNVVITDTHATTTDNCGIFGTQTTAWRWTAILVNTGGAGYADVGYDVNGQQVTANTYFLPANSQLPVSESATLHACYGSTNPTYDIVLLAERSA